MKAVEYLIADSNAAGEGGLKALYQPPHPKSETTAHCGTISADTTCEIKDPGLVNNNLCVRQIKSSGGSE